MQSIPTRPEIEAILASLAGEPLVGSWSYGGWEVFDFGALRPKISRKGEELLIPEHCFGTTDWCLTDASGPVISDDNPRRDDPTMQPFFERMAVDPLRIVEARLEPDDGATIELTEGYSLRIWVRPDPDIVHWYYRHFAPSWVLNRGEEGFYIEESENLRNHSA